MRLILASIIFASLISSSTHAEGLVATKSSHTQDVLDLKQNQDDYDPALLAEALEECVGQKKDPTQCVGIAPKWDGAGISAGARNDQEQIAWSVLVQKYDKAIVAKYPELQNDLKESQEVWSQYIDKNCKFESRTMLYDGKPVPHEMPWLEWRDYTRCLLDETFNRALYLRAKLNQ